LPILLGTGVDDNIVLSQRFAEEWGKNSQKSKVKSQKSLIDIKLSEFTDALRTTYKSTGMSVFLTTFTTFAAFTCGALITHVKVLESFYAMVALSMMGVFFLTVLLQGSLRSFLTRRGILIVSSSTPSRHLKLKSSFINFFRRLSTQVFKYQRWILVGLALFFILSCVGASRLESEFSPDLFLRKSMPTYKASYLEEKYFGFNNAGYIVFEGNVAQYELIQKMRELVLKMEKIKNIEKIFDKANVDSILVLIEKKGIIIKESTDVTKAFDEIANSDRTANYILNESYANLSKKYMHKSGDHYDALLMPLYIKGEESKTILGVYHQLQKAIHEIGLDQVPGVTVKISGVGFVHHLEAEYNVKSLLNSFLLSMLVNFLVLILLWRSLRLAVLAMLPLIIAVVLTLGWMWVTGVKLNIFNLSISMIIVGLGIDYPIHLIERYGEDPPKKTIADRIQAAQDMLLTMGPNLFIAALTTIIGFSASMIMTMPVAKSFGIFMSLGIFIVFVVTLVVIPIFLVKVPSPSRRDPFGIDGRG